jgi:2-oxoglutarate ferredoxin oxidoreductase subunit delta
MVVFKNIFQELFSPVADRAYGWSDLQHLRKLITFQIWCDFLLTGYPERRGEAFVKGQIRIKTALCKSCALCIEACPKGSIRISKKMNAKSYFPAEFVKGEDECTGCGLCAIVCPEAIIEVYREK